MRSVETSRAWITAAPMSSSILVTVARGINNGFIILRYVILAFVTSMGLINIKSYCEFPCLEIIFFFFILTLDLFTLNLDFHDFIDLRKIRLFKKIEGNF